MKKILLSIGISLCLGHSFNIFSMNNGQYNEPQKLDTRDWRKGGSIMVQKVSLNYWGNLCQEYIKDVEAQLKQR